MNKRSRINVGRAAWCQSWRSYLQFMTLIGDGNQQTDK